MLAVTASDQLRLAVRTGSWTGPARWKRAPRVGMSSTVFGMRTFRPYGPELHGLHLRSKKLSTFVIQRN